MSFDLFTYPHQPGYKARETAREAAHAVSSKAPIVRQRILALLSAGHELTPDEAAYSLNIPILTVRPRFSELAAQGLIEDSGARRLNSSGKRAIVWRLVPQRLAA